MVGVVVASVILMLVARFGLLRSNFFQIPLESAAREG